MAVINLQSPSVRYAGKNSEHIIYAPKVLDALMHLETNPDRGLIQLVYGGASPLKFGSPRFQQGLKSERASYGC